MGKSTHFIGQPLYGQDLNLLDKSKIFQISRENGGERYTKRFNVWVHLVVMLYAVIMRFDSLREITVSLLGEARKLNHLGLTFKIGAARWRMPTKDVRNTFSRRFTAICTADTGIFKGVGRHPKTGKKKGGIKVHTVIHANEGVPSDIKFTSAATNDSFMLKPATLNKGDIMAMDRAYIDYEKFEQLPPEMTLFD